MTINVNQPFFLDLDFLLEATLSGNAQATMPLSNLQTQNPREVWGSANGADVASLVDPSITATFAVNNEFNALAIIRHNLTINATYSLYGHSINDFSDLNVVDFKMENIDPYPPLFGAGEGDVAISCGAGGTPLPRQMPLYNNTAFITLPALQEFLYWKIIFTDPTNPDGFVKVGRIMFGYGWQPVHGMDFGHGLIDVDPSRQNITDGGGMIIDNEPQFRRLDFKFSNLEDSERYLRVYSMQKLIGKRLAIFVSLYPDVNVTANRFESMYGIIEKYSPITLRRHDFNEARFTLRELI